MPRKSDLIPIKNKNLDRRVKLNESQKKEIRENKSMLSQRELAKKYGVSRRLIQFILNPQAQEENIKRRQERGGSKVYYKKEYHTRSMRDHRKYKKQLYDKGLIQKPITEDSDI